MLCIEKEVVFRHGRVRVYHVVTLFVLSSFLTKRTKKVKKREKTTKNGVLSMIYFLTFVIAGVIMDKGTYYNV